MAGPVSRLKGLSLSRLGIARRFSLLFILFALAMTATAVYLNRLLDRELVDIATLRATVEQKEELIALQTSVNAYSTLLDTRQSVVMSRDFRALRAIREAIAEGESAARGHMDRLSALAPRFDQARFAAALEALREAHDTQLRTVATGDAVATAQAQKEIWQRREALEAAIAAGAGGAPSFQSIMDDLTDLSSDFSFAVGATVTIMLVAGLLFLALVVSSVLRPLNRLVLAVDRLDSADQTVLPEGGGPAEFEAIGRALEALGRRLQAQRRAEAQLRQSEARLRQFAECSADQFWETGVDFRYAWVHTPDATDTAGETDFDLQATEVLGRTRWELAGGDPATDPLWCRHRDEMLNRRAIRDFEYRIAGVGVRGHRWWRVNGAPMFDDRGGFIGYRGTATDITEQRQIADRLRQAQNRETIGRLAGGVAHDFNNLLTVLQSNLELLQARAELAGPLREMVARCIRATARGSRLTNRLLALGQRQSLQPEALWPAPFLAEFKELVQRTLPRNIRVATEVAEDLPAVFADAGSLQDALLNLVINARDAMPEGGRLTVSARRAVAAAPDAVPGESSGMERVEISIADTGGGIPEDLKDQIFEPFFSTKSAGGGTGLGLSMVRGFINQSGGEISIDSTPGQGTIIVIALPIAAPAGQSAAPADSEPLRQGRGEIVLLVENDDDVRSSMESILIFLGFRVIALNGAAEALKLLADSRQPIAFLLSDVVMPDGPQGDDLAVMVRQRHPEVPLALMSGHLVDGLRREVLDSGIPVLPKPVSTEKLQQVLRDALGAPRAEQGPSDR